MKSILTYPNRIYNNFAGKSKQKKQAGLLGRCFERGAPMELDYQAIGVRIRRLRKERGLTQQTLAEMSGQEPSNISHIERGATKLSLPTLLPPGAEDYHGDHPHAEGESAAAEAQRVTLSRTAPGASSRPPRPGRCAPGGGSWRTGRTSSRCRRPGPPSAR